MTKNADSDDTNLKKHRLALDHMGGADIPEGFLGQLHPLELKALPFLKEKTVSALAKKAKLSTVEAMRACQWLENKQALTLKPLITRNIYLDANAKKAIKDGMPEMRFLKAVQEGAKTRDEISKKAGLTPDEFGVSVGILKRAKVIDIGKKGIIPTANGKKVDTAKSAEITFLRRLMKNPVPSPKDKPLVDALKARKAYLTIKEHKDRSITLTPLGEKLTTVNIKNVSFAEKITRNDLESGSWKKKKYRAYDVTINVPQLHGGKIHFVQEAINYIRRIWLEMGFEEMSGSMVQSAFWDLDSLFVPQDHPARELQDTFYVKHPARTTLPKTIFERVRDTHEHGGTTGSKGWQTTYSKDEAAQLMLRTHGTVLSAQTLAKIRDGTCSMPGKYFTVAKVFRNEKLDWKHLFEFHQVEGIVVDKNVNLAQLIGYLRIFFAKMGYPKVRCRPSYFPYTEPSVEVDVWHPKKQQWIELGGSGIFRAEVTKTLIGEEVPVLAWGLGLERIIVEFFDLDDLRDLYKNDIKHMQHMKRFMKLEHG